MVVEDIVYAFLLKPSCHHIDVVGRVAPMNDMKPTLFVDFLGQPQFLAERTEILSGVAQCPVPLWGKVMTVNMHAVQVFIIGIIPFSFRAYHADQVAILCQCGGFLPNTGVERNRQVLDDNEDFSLHLYMIVMVVLKDVALPCALST